MDDRIIGFRFPTEAEIPLISIDGIGDVVEDPSSVTVRGKDFFFLLSTTFIAALVRVSYSTGSAG
jgi:hypothetical protein